MCPEKGLQPASAFHVANRRVGKGAGCRRLSSRCRSCNNEYRKRWHRRDSDAPKAYKLRWLEKAKERRRIARLDKVRRLVL